MRALVFAEGDEFLCTNEGGEDEMSKYFSESVGLASNEIIMEQLEERIVLDGEVSGWTQDADGVWHATDDDSLDYYWYSPDGAEDGVNDYYFRHDSDSGQWERDSDTLVSEDWNDDTWVLFGDPDDDSAFVYDGRWHNMGDGYWFAYNLGGQGYGYWWSMNDGNEYYCAYGYLTGGDWWWDANGYYIGGGWELLNGAFDSDDFYYDGHWHEMTDIADDLWYRFDDGNAYWWYTYDGAVYEYSYDYSDGQWYEKDGPAHYSAHGTSGASSDPSFFLISENQAPVNTVPGSQNVDEDSSLVFNTANGNLISISDPDAGDEPVKVYIMVSDGTLTLAQTTGLAFTSGADGTYCIGMMGTKAAINAALDGLTYTPDENFNGAVTLALYTFDLGNTGAGGEQYDGDTITITVDPVNDAPVGSAIPDVTLDEDFGTYVYDISGYFNDIDTGTLTYEVGTIADPDGVLDSYSFNATSGEITFTGAANQFGMVEVQVRAYDGTSYSAGWETFTVTVNPVNDAPVNTVPVAQTTEEDQDLDFGSSIFVSDVDAASGDIQVGLSVTNGTLTLSQTTGLVFMSGLNGSACMTFMGTIADTNSALNGLLYKPANDFNGEVVFTITTNDQGNSGFGDPQVDTDSINVTVTPDIEVPVQVGDINPTGSSSPSNFMEFNGDLYFMANDGTNGFELWSYDPLSDTLMPAADINPGSANSEPSFLTVYDGDLYFCANDGSTGAELWKYDPIDGAVLAADIWTGPGDSQPSYITVFDGELYFSANNGTSGNELWRYNPVDGATLVADINSSGDSNPEELIVFNGMLYFSASNGTDGVELWSYDPVTDIAEMVADINSSGSSNPRYLTVFSEALYFSAEDCDRMDELWRYDPVDGAEMVVEINTRGPSNPVYLTVIDDDLYFNATNEDLGGEPWRYNPAVGVELVADIRVGTQSSGAHGFTEFDGGLYFTAGNGLSCSPELWRYDPVHSVTGVADIFPGTHRSVDFLTVFHGDLYFTTSNGTDGQELWRLSQ